MIVFVFSKTSWKINSGHSRMTTTNASLAQVFISQGNKGKGPPHLWGESQQRASVCSWGWLNRGQINLLKLCHTQVLSVILKWYEHQNSCFWVVYLVTPLGIHRQPISSWGISTNLLLSSRQHWSMPHFLLKFWSLGRGKNVTK